MLRKTSKRFLSIVLAAAMLLSMMPFAAFAADGSENTSANDTTVEEGSNDVTQENAVASATITGDSEKYFATFEEAVKSVLNSDSKSGSVKLLKDSAGNGIVFPSGSNITIDFGNHHYDFDGTTVGSSGTETQGFQLLKDSTIILKNGTLTASTSKCHMLIQNYSNLTLENMNLDGTTATNSVSCVLSNNNGAVNITGNTTITAKEGGVAFDVCYWPAGGYPNGAQVTVNTTGTITGNIELGAYGITEDQTTAASTLTIQNIIHNGKITTSNATTESEKAAIESLKDNTEITGGKFSSDVSEFIAPGNALDENGNVVPSTDAEAAINGFGYETLDAALSAAKSGDTVVLLKDITSDSTINPNAGVTIDGAGYALTFSNNSAFTIQNDKVTIKNLTINAPSSNYAVQFYCNDGGELNGVTINGGAYAAVLVNGATGVNITDTTLNPDSTAYANIEYGMGDGVTTVPSMSIDNVTFSGNAENTIWIDNDTTNRIKEKTGAANDNAVLAAIQDNITYTSPNGGSLPISVELSEGKNTTIYEESTYEPPYTGKYSYEIFTKVGDNGTLDVEQYATEGDEVTFTVTPDEAYMLDEMTITSGGKEVDVTDNGDGTYTFTMPSGDVKINVTFTKGPDWEPTPDMPFTDVNENDWFYDVVLYAYENGLMTGTSADTFEPNTATTRGMIVSMLARLEGVTSAPDAGFSDVNASDWYATAVNWAASAGVVNGFEDNTFRANDPITREQMAAILYNYADYKGMDTSARADLSGYSDADAISSWATEVLAWANAEGYVNGMTATTLDPQGSATRAQVAAIFERFLEA